MDRLALKVAAIELENLLSKYSKRNRSARQCLEILRPILEDAKNMLISEPISDIPCGYTFHEGELRQYSDLEERYSNFRCLARDDDLQEVEKIIRGDI